MPNQVTDIKTEIRAYCFNPKTKEITTLEFIPMPEFLADFTIFHLKNQTYYRSVDETHIDEYPDDTLAVKVNCHYWVKFDNPNDIPKELKSYVLIMGDTNGS